MKMSFFSSRTSWVVRWICWKHSRYADVSRNYFRILPTVTKYDHFVDICTQWKLQIDVRAVFPNVRQFLWLHCSVRFIATVRLATVWLCLFSYVPVNVPYGTLAGPAWSTYGSRRIWKILKIDVRGPHNASSGIARGPCGVLRIIQVQVFTPQPFGLEGYCRHGSGGRAGGRAGGCQTCGTHISVTAWRIFSIRSSMELSRPVVVHCHGNLPICPIWACPWAKNLSNLPQIGSRLCGTHISETAGWIYPI